MLKSKTKIILLLIFLLVIGWFVKSTFEANYVPKFKFTEFRNVDNNVDNYEFMDSDVSSTFDISDKEVLYAVGKYNRQLGLYYHHSFNLGSLADGSSTVLSTLKDNTYLINAKPYSEGYLMSYVTNTFDKQGLFDFCLVYLNNGEEIIIDSYKGEYWSNLRLDFEIVGNKIVYVKNPINQPLEIILYDMKNDSRETINLENEAILDSAIKSDGKRIACFVDLGEQASFLVYDTVSKKKTLFPFDTEYRLFEYAITTDGIIASIISELNSDYNYTDDKKAILFIPFKGDPQIIDANSSFFLKSNGKICIGLDEKRELFVFDFKNLKISPIETGDVGKIYTSPVRTSPTSDGFYISTEWVYKNYDTEEKIVKMELY